MCVYVCVRACVCRCVYMCVCWAYSQGCVWGSHILWNYKDPQLICLPPSWLFESCSAQAPCLTQLDSAPASTWLCTLFVATSVPHTLVCAMLCADSQSLTQLKCGVLENNSKHGQGGVLYSHHTHTAWKADQVTSKHFISCIGYAKAGRSAQKQVIVYSHTLIIYTSMHKDTRSHTRTLIYTNKGSDIPAYILAL